MHFLGVGKKMKVARNGPMYTHSDFRTSADSRACAAAKSMRRASVHAPKAPDRPGGARIFWRVAPKNSSFSYRRVLPKYKLESDACFSPELFFSFELSVRSSYVNNFSWYNVLR